MSNLVHGGRLDAAIAAFGGELEDWLDLSTGINPNAYPLPEILPRDWQRLPDEAAESALIETARHYYRVPEGLDLVAANGTQAIIQALPAMLQYEKVAILGPTYEEHGHCWAWHGRTVIHCKTLDEAVHAADLVVVVNPNNPTGTMHTATNLREAAQTLAGKNGMLVVDEAFCDLFPQLSIVPRQADNVITLKSFGKFFGLAGVRLGFVICNRKLASRLGEQFGPWCVSGPALRLGTHAYGDEIWTQKTREEVLQHGEAQGEVIAACGLKPIGNAGLFMEFEHHSASLLHEKLQERHILARAFPARKTRLRFGLCKNMDELERLALALKSLVQEIE